MTISDALTLTIRNLTPVAGDFALPEAEQIFETLLKKNRDELYRTASMEFPADYTQRLSSIIERRLTSEPLPYILGTVYFYNREFIVTPDVLIPRPDSETLVETVLEMEKEGVSFCCDIGTGSGILVSVLTEQRRQWKAVAIDISAKALAVARKNEGPRVLFVRADLVDTFKGESFDFIISNPPYLSDRDMRELDKSVKEFEPLSALYGGQDGFDFYRRIAFEAAQVLKKNGRIYCEIGFAQAASVAELFTSAGWKQISIRKDLGQRDRVMTAIKGD
jgi:release factor glutamine methyltransferase